MNTSGDEEPTIPDANQNSGWGSLTTVENLASAHDAGPSHWIELPLSPAVSRRARAAERLRRMRRAFRGPMHAPHASRVPEYARWIGGGVVRLAAYLSALPPRSWGQGAVRLAADAGKQLRRIIRGRRL
jgi:hypothetical protein